MALYISSVLLQIKDYIFGLQKTLKLILIVRVKVSVEVDGNVFGLRHLVGERLHIKQRAEHVEFVNICVEGAPVQ